jgi:GDP-4-dehydro-6-deoxy-D-mannose reductase
MNKILITGISGFAGSHLRDYLLTVDNLSIFGTDLSGHIKGDNKTKIYTLDLTKVNDVEKLIKDVAPDYIFHLAALSSPAKSFTDPYQTFYNNIKAELNLLESVRKYQPKARVLIIGSGDEYGLLKKEDNPIDENQSFNPTSPYAVSKITQDLLGLQYFISYKLDIIRVRPFNHIGPRQKDTFVVASFAKQIAEIEAGLKEPVIKVGNLSSIRDFTDVTDMVRAYWLALKFGKSGEVYNIGSQKGYSMEEILNILLSMATKKTRIQIDKTLLRPSDNPVLICNYDKFNELTGWKPMVNIKESLKQILIYWRNKLITN